MRILPSFWAAAFAAFLFLTVGSSNARASVFTVLTLNDSGPRSLRQALDSANADPGSTITFAPGLSGTITLSSELIVTNNVTIQGPGANVLSIAGGSGVRIFQIFGGSTTLSGLTLTGATLFPG